MATSGGAGGWHRAARIPAIVGEAVLTGVTVGLSVFQVQAGGKPGPGPQPWETPKPKRSEYRP